MSSEVYCEAFADGIRPPPDFDVDEWADNHRYLSTKTSAYPGRWNTDVVPYARMPMKCLSRSHPAEKIVLMWPSQSSKTEIILNAIGANMCYNPGPMMVVQPTIGMSKKFSKQRLKSLILDSPQVLKVFGGKYSTRDGSNTILEKEFPGGMLMLVGSNAPSALASMPIRDVYADEVDRNAISAGNEGSPLQLAIQRTTNFPDRKILITSTPTVKNKSVIEGEYQETNQCELHLPCPHCEHYQMLIWDRLDYKTHGVENPVYKCENCEEEIEEHNKRWMLKNHKWVPQNPDAPKNNWGFHFNALSIPFPNSSWKNLVAEWKAAQKDSMKLRVFVNTRLAQTWESRGETPDWEKIFLRRENYPLGAVPEKALVLTAGVDVQNDRLEVEVVGWGENLESWSVDYKTIQGDPAKEEVWEKLEELRRTKYPHELGNSLEISAMAVDSGYSTSNVYRYCRQHHPSRVMAVKGKDNLSVPVSSPKKVDYTQGGKTINNGAVLRTVGTEIIKSEIYGWLGLTYPEENEDGEIEFPFGWCHFPEYSQEYFKQLCAEKLVMTVSRGRSVFKFEKHRDRNEALDCRVYARAAAITLEIDRFTPSKWERLRQRARLTVEENTVRNTGRDYSTRDRQGRRQGEWKY